MRKSLKEVMKNFLLLFVLLFPLSNHAQNFSVQAYKRFLQEHQSLSSQQLMGMYPTANFSANLNINLSDILFLDSVEAKFNLTAYEKNLLRTNGFMVSERLYRTAFGASFLEIYNKDLPVYVTADALLHAFHISYDRILKDIEYFLLFDKLKLMLSKMHGAMPQLHARYQNTPSMLTMLKDADVYLTVARKLAGVTTQPYYSDNTNFVNTLIGYVDAYQAKNVALFSSQPRRIDFSQFKPRGHYIADPQYYPEIDKYFKAIMWLGRIELYLIGPKNVIPPVSFATDQRQIIISYLIKESFELGNASADYETMEDMVKFFVGDQDNVTLPQLDTMKNETQINFASDFLDSLKVVQFQNILKTKEFAYQLILSQILTRNPMSPDSILPAAAFMLFGQRFVIDSYVTGSVVFDRIPGQICRLYPSVLDPMFALGNSAVAQFLQPELNQYHYSLNLAGLRYLIDSYGQEFWDGTMYNNWLAGIRALNPPIGRNDYPQFMHTAAYWQRLLNTQLTSWTQLRHDNLLYAKQSYTGGSICSYPYAYVEPFPELYLRLKKIGEIGKVKFAAYTSMKYFFANLDTTCGKLATIAQKELDGTPLSPDELFWLKRIIYMQDPGSGGSPYNGWYANLYYRDQFIDENKGLLQNDFLVADIHTVPTYCGGGYLGAVMHVGTGPVNLGIFVVESQGQKVAYVGPNYSFYQYTTLNFLRLTDQEWQNTYLWLSARPAWVNIYLADSSGNSRGDGPSFITNAGDEQKNIFAPDEISISNYPNPFNSSTLIKFNVPFGSPSSFTELTIYNIQGEVVRRLFSDELSPGNYLIRWEGENENGRQVSSGTYVYSLQIGKKIFSNKLMLVK